MACPEVVGERPNHSGERGVKAVMGWNKSWV